MNKKILYRNLAIICGFIVLISIIIESSINMDYENTTWGFLFPVLNIVAIIGIIVFCVLVRYIKEKEIMAEEYKNDLEHEEEILKVKFEIKGKQSRICEFCNTGFSKELPKCPSCGK